MRVLRAVIGVALAVAVLEGLRRSIAPQDGGLSARLHQAVGRTENGSRAQPSYDLYGGPNPEPRCYSYPPYGYQPPPPPSPTSSPTRSSPSTGRGRHPLVVCDPLERPLMVCRTQNRDVEQHIAQFLVGEVFVHNDTGLREHRVGCVSGHLLREFFV